MSDILPMGTQTIVGEVVAVGWRGERYYFLLAESGVSLMPAIVIEARAVQKPVQP